MRENKEYKIQNILFSQEYLKFVSSLLEDLQRHDPDTQSMVLKYTNSTDFDPFSMTGRGALNFMLNASRQLKASQRDVAEKPAGHW